MNILSISSRVAYGHVGHAASVFCLQRLGHEVWPVETTLLSNHLGYPAWGGRQLARDEVAMVIDGLERLGVFAEIDVLATGFLGQAPELVAAALAKLRRLRPDLLYALDPVMGERLGGLYVPPATAACIKERLLGEAGLVLPEQLRARPSCGRTRRDARATPSPPAARSARGHGPISRSLRPASSGSMATRQRSRPWRWGRRACSWPRPNAMRSTPMASAIASPPSSSATISIADATSRRRSAGRRARWPAVVAATGDARELALVAAQQAFAEPPERVRLTRLD